MGESPPQRPDDLSGKTEILVGHAKEGSQEAWSVLYARYRKMLLAHLEARIPGFARRRLDAEDVLQAGLTRAWQKIGKFVYRGEGSFRRWLAQLVVNTCLNEVEAQRSAVRQQAHSQATLDELAQRDARERIERDDRTTAMLEAMGKLDEEDRDLLIQHIIERLSFEEIAAIQGYSREKAREQYSAALERLERRMRA